MHTSMLRPLLICFMIGVASLSAQTGGRELIGRVEGKTYVSPTGAFTVPIPVLPELGGRIVDTDNVVTFQDNFNVMYTIAAFPMDATQRWEHSTRGLKDYLAYFFANFVMPDFQQSFQGARAESAKFVPSLAGGSLLVYTLLPGGSMFADKLTFVSPDEKLPEAKRGNIVFVHDGWIFVLSMELAERITERSSYHKTTAEEDDLLRQRLVELYKKLEFTKPAVSSP